MEKKKQRPPNSNTCSSKKDLSGGRQPVQKQREHQIKRTHLNSACSFWQLVKIRTKITSIVSATDLLDVRTLLSSPVAPVKTGRDLYRELTWILTCVREEITQDSRAAHRAALGPSCSFPAQNPCSPAWCHALTLNLLRPFSEPVHLSNPKVNISVFCSLLG